MAAIQTATPECPAAMSRTSPIGAPVLSESEFRQFQRLIYDTAGIKMSDAKRPMVCGRLARRLRELGFTGYQQYLEFIFDAQGAPEQLAERQMAIDLLTTNETYFFREPKHFDYMAAEILPTWASGKRRVWSAASSSGEEAYTIAMVLAEHSPTADWEVVGTDISSRMVERARSGLFPLARADKVPRAYLHKYCLKGVGNMAGYMRMDRPLQSRTRFHHANLRERQQELGLFDLIFLRNVMIYFDTDTKRQVVTNVIRQLKPGGYLMIGHSESLQGISGELRMRQSAIYQKPR